MLKMARNKDIQFRRKTIIAVAVALVIVVAWPMVFRSDFYLNVGSLALIGTILALGLNMFLGHAGQINFGAAGFYAIGAYTAALLPAHLGVPFPLGIVAAPMVAGIVAYLLSFPLLRLRGHGLAVGTFGFAYLIYMISDIWADFTGGGTGIKTVTPVFFGCSLRGSPIVYYIILLAAILSFVLCHLVTQSHHGRALKTIRNDELLALANGIDVSHYWAMALVINGILGGLAGGLLTLIELRVGPGFFQPTENIRQLFMVVLGGVGANWGAILGGIITSFLPELLWKVEKYFTVIYGLILLLLIRFFPNGIWGSIVLLDRFLSRKFNLRRSDA